MFFSHKVCFLIAIAILFFPSPSLLANPLELAARAVIRKEFSIALDHLSYRPTEPEAKLLRAYLLLQLKRFSEAEQSLRFLPRKLSQLKDFAHYLHGEALYGMGQYTLAERAFRAAVIAKDSRWVYQSFRRRADSLFAKKRYSSADALYQHLIRILPTTSDARPELELASAICKQKLGKKKAAALLLQSIWWQWPNHRASSQAEEQLAHLKRIGIKIPLLSVSMHLSRIQSLKQAKRFNEAMAEIKSLLKSSNGSEIKTRLNLIMAEIYFKTHEPQKALVLLKPLFSHHQSMTAQRDGRLLMARCLAAVGRVAEGAQFLSSISLSSPLPTKLTPATREELKQAAKLLADYGYYREALTIYDQLSADPRQKEKYRHKRAWLAYRAGLNDVALQAFEALGQKEPKKKDFVFYWKARIHDRMGNKKQAEKLYQKLLDEDSTNYYALLARSRLAEAKKIKLKAGKCDKIYSITAPATDSWTEVAEQLSVITDRYGELFPALYRTRSFWRLGLIKEARRELRLISIDTAWIAARGRPRQYIQRPDVEKLWRGGPLPPRRWGKRERRAYKEMATFRRDFSRVLDRAEVSYFGWTLGTPDPDPLRRRYPRAYPNLVKQIAQRFKLDPNLLWAIMRTESTYRLDVISRVGATGLMQIMPRTAQRIADAMKLEDFRYDQLFEPEINLRMAGWYLKALSDKFNHQLGLVAAAYNGGPHHVARWLDQRGKGAAFDEFIEEISFSESRRYAKKIVRLVALYERLYCAKEDRIISNILDTRYAPEPDF